MVISKTKVYEVLDKLSMVLLCVLMVDVCILAHLKLFDVAFFGNRMALLLALIIVSIPKMIMNFKNIIKNKFVLMILAFGVWIVFSTILGLVNNNSIKILTIDVKGFFYFVFIPVALCVLDTKERIHTLMKVLMYATIAISAIYLAHLIIYLVSYKTFNQLMAFGMKTKFSIISSVTPKIPRIFIANAMFLLCGCAFPLYFFIEEKDASKKKLVQYPLICGLSLFSLMITYTRSVYVGIFVALVGCLATYIIKTPVKTIKRLFAFILVSIATFLVVVGSFNISQKTDYLSFAIARTFGTISIQGTGDTNSKTESVVSSNTTESSSEPTSSTVVDNSSTPESSTVTPSSSEIVNSTVVDNSSKPTDTKLEDEFGYYLDETKKSDKLRTLTVNELLENIKASPIIGHGLGKGLKVRGNGESLNEYSYLDIMSKTGIIGLVLFVLPALYMVFALLFKKGKKFNMAKIWVSVLLGFMVFSYFNPYMPCSLGILMYCCAIASFEICNKLDKEGQID